MGIYPEVMPIMRSGLFSAKKEGGLLTIPRCCRTGKKRDQGSRRGENQAKNIKRGSIAAGLGRNIQKQPIIPHGRSRMGYTTQQ